MEKIIAKVAELQQKYSQDAFMYAKVEHYICNQLPILLESFDKSRNERIIRHDEMSAEQEAFTKNFFNTHKCFYMASSDSFFIYDGVHYSHITEDALLHNILSSISKDRGNLMSWKYKTKSLIMKRIRETSVVQCIPESCTIQAVLNALCPMYFSSKTEAKYFLSILGENIMKSVSGLVHLAFSKTLITQLNAFCQLWFSTNLNQSFKYKHYAEQTFVGVRQLNIISNKDDGNSLLYNMKNTLGLDLLCVACHYADRFGGSEAYLYSDDALVASVCALQQYESPTNLVEKFASELQYNKDSVVSWKNMHYLWKLYLERMRLPSAITQPKLRTLLTELLKNNYDESKDCFIGVTSIYLPGVQEFLNFWNTQMVFDDNEIEIELGEIVVLYKNHTGIAISEKQLLGLLRFYYPDVDIDQEKYIYKMRCLLWNKQADMTVALRDFDSIDDPYVWYCNYKRHSDKNSVSHGLCVSKRYFTTVYEKN